MKSTLNLVDDGMLYWNEFIRYETEQLFVLFVMWWRLVKKILLLFEKQKICSYRSNGKVFSEFLIELESSKSFWWPLKPPLVLFSLKLSLNFSNILLNILKFSNYFYPLRYALKMLLSFMQIVKYILLST